LWALIRSVTPRASSLSPAMFAKPLSSADEKLTCHSPRVIFSGAVGVGILGFLVTAWWISIMTSDGFKTVSKMIEKDEGDEKSSVRDATEDCVVHIIMGLLTCFLAVVGCFAASSERAGMTSSYMIGLAVLVIWYLAITVSISSFTSSVVPVLTRQHDRYCNATTIGTYKIQLSCPIVAPAAIIPVQPCGEVCEVYVADLREMGGCKLLDDLCKDKAVFIEQVTERSVKSSVLSGLVFVAVLAAAVCACNLQYTLVTKRQGKKGAGQLCLKMICPCAPNQERKGLGRADAEELVGSSDEE